MSHVHSHAHAHHHVIESVGTTLIVCILLNLLFVIVEAGIGFAYHSLGLLSDAGHNLSDVFSLLLSLFAIRMATRKGNSHFTYGYKKSTVLVSLVNAVILLIAVGGILIESIYKLKSSTPISGEAISWTAGVGILINGATALLRRSCRIGHPHQCHTMLPHRCLHRYGHSPYHPDFYLETAQGKPLPVPGCHTRTNPAGKTGNSHRTDSRR